MKKIIVALVAVYCSAMLPIKAGAQKTDWNKYCTLNSQVKTVREYFMDYPNLPYDQDSLRAGIETIIYYFEITLTEREWPESQLDTLTALFTFSDLYGRELVRLNASKEIMKCVNNFIKYHTYGSFDSNNKDYLLSQGGKYELRTIFDLLNIDRKDTVTIYDDPSLRVNGSFTIKTGDDFDIAGYYNTGYPYDINSLTGEEYADVTIYKMETDSTGRETFKHRFPLHLKDEAHPLLAGWDSLFVNIIKPEIGPYIMRFETNWDAVETRNISLSVEDTLRATITLDKDTYNFASDKQATMHMTMDYSYPYIHEMEPDTIPTIRVAASLFRDNSLTDMLFTDTLKLVSDTLSTKDLHYVSDWNLDWTKIDASELTPEDSTYYMKVSIIFNLSEQYNTIIPLRVDNSVTNIRSAAVWSSNDEETYTLDGIRVDTSKPLPRGIYIQKGKKISINK